MSKSPNTVATNVTTTAAASSTVRRRGVMVGAGVVGAAAAAAALLPRAMQSAPTAPVETAVAPKAGGGYRLSEHVQQYYDTARV